MLSLTRTGTVFKPEAGILIVRPQEGGLEIDYAPQQNTTVEVDRADLIYLAGELRKRLSTSDMAILTAQSARWVYRSVLALLTSEDAEMRALAHTIAAVLVARGESLGRALEGSGIRPAGAWRGRRTCFGTTRRASAPSGRKDAEWIALINNRLELLRRKRIAALFEHLHQAFTGYETDGRPDLLNEALVAFEQIRDRSALAAASAFFGGRGQLPRWRLTHAPF